MSSLSVSAPFIHRPVATSLLGVAVMLGGLLGYWLLPVSSLPQVDFPTIQVSTQLPGASPDTIAALVTAPLERQFGQIPSLTSMTSASSFGISQVTLQFDLNRDIDGAAQDVQSAINAARSTLPSNLPYPPTYAKVNPADVLLAIKPGGRRIIANPNCSTIQMVVALKPLHDLAKITRVVVSTYQSVSGAGRAAMDELFTQTRGIYVNDPAKPDHFPKQIAFNVIPQIDVFMDDGSTKEEWKMVAETRKILDGDVAVTATCVRVPVFIGHAEAITVEFANPITVEQARAALSNAPGVVVVDHRVEEGYVTPAEVAGEDAT